MSRVSEKEKVASPVKYRLKFKGDTGEWAYWEKESESEVSLEVLDFIVLETMSSITGWNDELEKSIYSNLFRSAKDDEISVRAGGKEIVSGTYSDKKAVIKEAGGKFTTNVFALALIDGEYVPVRIEFVGGSVTSWIDFSNEHGKTNIYSYKITGQKGDLQKKGGVKYYVPSFTFVEADDDLVTKADDFTAEELEPYINQ